MSIQSWETLNSEFVFKNQWYTVRQDTVKLPSGRILNDYFVSVRPDIALVFALTPDNDVLFVRQFKQGIQKITLELSAGTFTDEPPQVAAERELREETGYRCDNLFKIGQVYDDASKNNNLVHIFLGLDAYRVGEQQLDPNEVDGGLQVETLNDVLDKVRERRDRRSIDCCIYLRQKERTTHPPKQPPPPA